LKFSASKVATIFFNILMVDVLLFLFIVARISDGDFLLGLCGTVKYRAMNCK